MSISLSEEERNLHAGHQCRMLANRSIFREKQIVEMDLFVRFRGKVSMTGQGRLPRFRGQNV
jgi:hypothetical protein